MSVLDRIPTSAWLAKAQATLFTAKQTLLLSAAGICLGLAFGLFAVATSGQQQRLDQAEAYATTIAALGAEQSGTALFNNDLLSLQVLLNNLVSLTDVSGVTVHDVENRVLARVGEMLTGDNSLHVSAVIAQSDNIAGYLTVIMAKPSSSGALNRWFAAFAFIASVILALLAKPFAVVNNRFEAEDLPAAAEDINQNLDAAMLEAGEDEPPHSVVLALTANRLPQLGKQLSSDLLNQHLQRLGEHINAVAKLYGARVQTSGQSLPNLIFTGHDPADNAMHALCSAQLILAIGYRQQSPLGLSAQVEEVSNDPEHIAPGLRACGAAPTYLGVSTPLADLLEGRVCVRAGDYYWLEVESFDERYQTLLDNQLAQLAQA